jgi:hypothetical protein
MPMPCWVRDRALIAALLLCACAPAPAGSAANESAQAAAAKLMVEGVAVPITLDRADIDPAGDHETVLIERRGNLALVMDSYASRPQGMSRCQAGFERYVRLIDLAARTERFAKRVESCLHDVVPGDPPATWPPDGRTLTVNLLSEPSVTVPVAPAQ